MGTVDWTAFLCWQIKLELFSGKNKIRCVKISPKSLNNNHWKSN